MTYRTEQTLKVLITLSALILFIAAVWMGHGIEQTGTTLVDWGTQPGTPINPS